jgi:hypothetical protein
MEMPFTRQQVKFLLSSGSPVSAAEKEKIKGELHADPSLGHARKGSSEMKRGRMATAFRKASHHGA